MEEKISCSPKLKYASLAMILIGIIATILAFLGDSQRAWANLLLSNYYFLSIALGASFFLAIQYIAQAGWSAAFKRIPEAMSRYIPLAAIFMFVGLLGIKQIYPWINPEEAGIFNEHEFHLLHHKEAYLNVPFFIIRMVFYFMVWIFMTFYLRKLSVAEDRVGGLEYFKKSEYYSKVYIFLLAFTFIFASIDWIMSLEPIWFSTIFAAKNFMSSFYHGTAVIILIVILLHNKGYLSFMNKAHWHDFSKYLFMLSIFFGYFWYSQYMLLWYANIPEETSYYVLRREHFSQAHFVINLILNFAIPFVVLLPNFLARKKGILLAIVIILLIGHFVDLYEQIMPGATGEYKIGFTEIGIWLGFAGIFTLVTMRTLTKANIIPVNHPYLQESIQHSEH